MTTKKTGSFETREPRSDVHWQRSNTSKSAADYSTAKFYNRTADTNGPKINTCYNGSVSKERHSLSKLRAGVLHDDPPDDSYLGNYCSVSFRDYQPFTYSSSWDKNPQVFHPAPTPFTKTIVYDPKKGSIPKMSSSTHDYPAPPLGWVGDAAEIRRNQLKGGSGSRDFFDMLEHSPNRSTGVSLTKTDFNPFEFERQRLPRPRDKLREDWTRSEYIITPPPSNKNSAVEMRGMINRHPTEVWHKKEPAIQSVYDCSYKLPPFRETVKEHDMHHAPSKNAKVTVRNIQHKIWEGDNNPERFSTHYRTHYAQMFDQPTNPKLPYLVNEHCRVDADFVN